MFIMHTLDINIRQGMRKKELTPKIEYKKVFYRRKFLLISTIALITHVLLSFFFQKKMIKS